jgi:glycosyltransferase involved in cell wall biosynthesis
VRIAYLGQMADVSTENGISKKIRAQAAAWLTAGHSVRYFSLTPTTVVWPGLAPLESEIVQRGPPWTRIARSMQLCQRIQQWQPDVIYFRYAYHSPGLPRLFCTIPTVAEINSDDTAEYTLTLSLAKRCYHRITRGHILRPIIGFVTVTRELASHFAVWKRPTMVIGNGIALDAFSFAPVSTPNTTTRVVFLGTAGSPWHGLERVDELARLMPDVHFDIVGLDVGAWGVQTNSHTPPPNIHLHGTLPRSAYETILTRATAALGSLALYKNGMNEACPLKVREYLALGLPVIAAYEDTDIPESADYFLRLPNCAESLAPQQERIAAFLGAWQNRRVPRNAVAHLDTTVKEARRLSFLQNVVQSSRR